MSQDASAAVAAEGADDAGAAVAAAADSNAAAGPGAGAAQPATTTSATAAGPVAATTAAPAQAAAPAQPTPAQPAADWRSAITDPALKNIADRIASPVDAIKVIQDLRTQNSQRIKVPGEGATEEDLAKYRKAIGVPDKPDGYEVTLPDGLQMTEADQAVLSQIAPIAHETGVPKEAFNKFVGKYLELSKQAEQQAIQTINQFGEQAEKQLKREWQGEYDRNVNLAGRLAETIGGAEFKAFLNETPIAGGGMLGDHPVLVRFLATVARRTDEGDLMLTATPEEKQNIQSEIDAMLKENPVGSAGYAKKDFQEKLQGLYEKKYGSAPIIGAGQRTI